MADIDDTPEVVTEDPREDWKARAIRAEAQMELMGSQQRAAAPAPEPAPDPVAEIDQQIAELEAQMPKIVDNDTFQEANRIRDQVNNLRMERVERKVMQTIEPVQQGFQQTRVQTQTQAYKSRFQGDMEIIGKQFDEAVRQLAPEYQTEAMYDVVRKNLMYDHIQSGGEVTRGSPQGGAADASYRRRGTTGAKKDGGVQLTDQEAMLAEYYGMTPEEYKDPRLTELSPEANGNGTSIYTFPEQKKARRYNRRG